MPSVILELITSTILIGTVIKYVKKKWKNKPDIYGRYCICYTKGNKPGEFTYIPWITRTYKNEDEFEYEEKELAKLAHNPIENHYFRNQGIIGFSVIDLEDGCELYWVRLHDKKY